MKKKFCVVQYYRLEMLVEAGDKDAALSLVQDHDCNFYTVSASMDNPDNNVESISVHPTDMDTEVYLMEGESK